MGQKRAQGHKNEDRGSEAEANKMMATISETSRGILNALFYVVMQGAALFSWCFGFLFGEGAGLAGDGPGRLKRRRVKGEGQQRSKLRQGTRPANQRAAANMSLTVECRYNVVVPKPIASCEPAPQVTGVST